jgi:hypothetical protein
MPKTSQEPESKLHDTFESGQGEARNDTKEEIGIRIGLIAVQGPSIEDTEIIILPDSSGEAPLYARGFRLAGNEENKPFYLVVRTKDNGGAEFVQFLPWNQNDPNAFRLHGPLHGYASVAVYDSNKLIGRFYVTNFTNEEMIHLDLGLCRYKQIARL